MNRPPRSLHLPARKPSSWVYLVVLLSLLLRGLRPPSKGAASESFRVALSRASRIPPLTRVRRWFPGVTRLRRGDACGVDDLIVSEFLLGVRVRVRSVGLPSRIGAERCAYNLDGGPTPSIEGGVLRCGSRARLALRHARFVPATPLLRVLSQVRSRLAEKSVKISLSRERSRRTPLIRTAVRSTRFIPLAAEINQLSLLFPENVSFEGNMQNFCRECHIREKYAEIRCQRRLFHKYVADDSYA